MGQKLSEKAFELFQDSLARKIILGVINPLERQRIEQEIETLTEEQRSRIKFQIDSLGQQYPNFSFAKEDQSCANGEPPLM